MNIHFPGLQKWVLPELDETYAPKPKSVYAYRDLIELFDTTTKLHSKRTAMRMERGGRQPNLTATAICASWPSGRGPSW